MRHGRHGFTMIEVLIALVLVGVLVAMMMMSSDEAEKSARAQNIINNFNQISKAVNSWYLDNLNRIVTNGTSGQYNVLDTDGKTKLALKKFAQDRSDEITKYLSNGNTIKITGKEDKSIKAGDYLLIDINYKYWYVCYDTGKDTRLREKLAGRANSLGLVAVNDNLSGVGSKYSGGRFVGISVLDLDR